MNRKTYAFYMVLIMTMVLFQKMSAENTSESYETKPFELGKEAFDKRCEEFIDRWKEGMKEQREFREKLKERGEVLKKAKKPGNGGLMFAAIRYCQVTGESLKKI